jgi:hypothetical protein
LINRYQCGIIASKLIKMIGKPIRTSNIIGTPMFNPAMQKNFKTPAPKKDKDDIISGINYIADTSGCGHYRMIWPSYTMNSLSKFVISDCKRVVLDPSFYRNVNVVRFQRQVSNTQLELFKKIRTICDKTGTRMIYEIDDIPFYEDIPIYNKNRKSYARQDYRENIMYMMNMSDEVTVTTKYMRDNFLEKLDTNNITVLPNYMPKFWMDRYYDENKLKVNLSKNKKKPRILYAGSGSHYGSAGVEDDFTKLEAFVRQTVNQYQWVFFGGVSYGLMDLCRSGKIEFHNYTPIVNYPELFDSLKVNIAIAPLLKNNFNKAKSNIKFIEHGACGIPCICQDDIVTYEDALYKFDTPDELNDQIKMLTKDSNTYMKAARKSRTASEKWWLEDNITKWEEIYKYSFGDKRREQINNLQ